MFSEIINIFRYAGLKPVTTEEGVNQVTTRSPNVVRTRPLRLKYTGHINITFQNVQSLVFCHSGRQSVQISFGMN